MFHRNVSQIELATLLKKYHVICFVYAFVAFDQMKLTVCSGAAFCENRKLSSTPSGNMRALFMVTLTVLTKEHRYNEFRKQHSQHTFAHPHPHLPARLCV